MYYIDFIQFADTKIAVSENFGVQFETQFSTDTFSMDLPLDAAGFTNGTSNSTPSPTDGTYFKNIDAVNVRRSPDEKRQ